MSHGIGMVGAMGAVIGGAIPGAGNIIAHNGERGILVSGGSNHTILGNRIGIGGDGAPAANGLDGIAVLGDASSVTIGSEAAPNIVAHNHDFGVRMFSETVQITLSANSIFSNGLAGIIAMRAWSFSRM